MAVGKINQDVYVGSTGKQLKDIKTNTDNIAKNSANISKHDIQLKYLENVEWIHVYSSRKTKSLNAWSATTLEDLRTNGGNTSECLEYTTSGVKIKKECTVLVFAQGTIKLPVNDCGIRIFVNSNQMAEYYGCGNGNWTYMSTFAIISCAKGDIVKLAYMCGITGTYEYLENTGMYVLVLK